MTDAEPAAITAYEVRLDIQRLLDTYPTVTVGVVQVMISLVADVKTFDFSDTPVKGHHLSFHGQCAVYAGFVPALRRDCRFIGLGNPLTESAKADKRRVKAPNFPTWTFHVSAVVAEAGIDHFVGFITVPPMKSHL